MPELGRAILYDVFDLGQNAGWVSVGMDHDTVAFAVESIRRWWYSMGKPIYRKAKRLLITADAGVSSGPKVRLWKVELQRFLSHEAAKFTLSHWARRLLPSPEAVPSRQGFRRSAQAAPALATPGACYAAFRRLPRRDSHPQV